MSEGTDYSQWFGQELKKLIDLISSGVISTDATPIHEQINQVERGIGYGINNKGAIDSLLLKLGQTMTDSLKIHLKKMGKRKPGVPIGGVPTFLAGSTIVDENAGQFNVDELKGALKSRNKKKMEEKMKGSMNLLKEYDE